MKFDWPPPGAFTSKVAKLAVQALHDLAIERGDPPPELPRRINAGTFGTVVGESDDWLMIEFDGTDESMPYRRDQVEEI